MSNSTEIKGESCLLCYFWLSLVFTQKHFAYLKQLLGISFTQSRISCIFDTHTHSSILHKHKFCVINRETIFINAYIYIFFFYIVSKWIITICILFVTPQCCTSFFINCHLFRQLVNKSSVNAAGLIMVAGTEVHL